MNVNLIVQERTNAARIYALMKENILKCVYAPGEILNERQLASKFEISRTPVREALYKLEMEGLVKRYPNVGIMVKGLSVKDLLESFEVRLLIEPYAARKATGIVKDETLNEILHGFESLDENNSSNNENYLNHYDLDRKLHEQIVAATGNGKLISIIEQMQICVDRLRWIGVKARFDDSVREHSKIIKHMLERNPDQAALAMEEHLRNSVYTLQAAL